MNLSSIPNQQRDVIKQLSPPFLSQGSAEKFMYTFGLCMDLLLEKANQAVKIRWPGQGSDTALPYLAQDRVLVQGPAESNASFIARLRGAFQAWRKAGSRLAILGQLQAYLENLQPGVAAVLPEMLIVGGSALTSSHTAWDTIYNGDAVGAPPSHQLVSPENWTWDDRKHSHRSWLVLHMHLVATGQTGTTASIASTGGSGVPGVTSGFAVVNGLSGLVPENVQQYLTITMASSSGNRGTFQIQEVISGSSCRIANPSAVAPDASNGAIHWSIGSYPYIGPAPVWGSPSRVWGQNLTWGLNCSPLVVQSILGILRAWKSAGTYYPAILVSFAGGSGAPGSEFSPNSSPGAGNPDANWGSPGKNVNGVWVPSQVAVSTASAVCDGTGRYVQCSVHNVT